MTDVTEAIKERINGSFSGPFSLIFFIFNWKILIITILSDANSQEKISEISAILHSPGAWIWPLLITMIYILAMPLINKQIETYQLYQLVLKNKSLEKKRLEIDDTIVYKFFLAQKIAEFCGRKLNLAITTNRTFNPDVLINMQKKLAAIQEPNEKSLIESCRDFTDLY